MKKNWLQLWDVTSSESNSQLGISVFFKSFQFCTLDKKVPQSGWVNFIKHKCYKSVQRFRVTCLFPGQYDAGEYGTIAGGLKYYKP